MKADVRILNGYRCIYLPDHPRAFKGRVWGGYTYEHIVVAEEALGRPLTASEVVHHLDQNRANNRHENLLVLERSQHTKLHAWLMMGVNKEPSQELHTCETCGKLLQDQQKRFCSSKCRTPHYKVAHPTKDQLTQDLAQMSRVKVGAKYGVSEAAIRKWIQAYKL